MTRLWVSVLTRRSSGSESEGEHAIGMHCRDAGSSVATMATKDDADANTMQQKKIRLQRRGERRAKLRGNPMLHGLTSAASSAASVALPRPAYGTQRLASPRRRWLTRMHLLARMQSQLQPLRLRPRFATTRTSCPPPPSTRLLLRLGRRTAPPALCAASGAVGWADRPSLLQEFSLTVVSGLPSATRSALT